MKLSWAAAVVLMVSICGTARAQELPAMPAPPPPPPINSPAFAWRAPAPGQLGYLQTIKFIDDGMRYVDPQTGFFVSPFGELCFRISPDSPQPSYFYAAYRNWCIYPRAVDRVEGATDDVKGVYKVRLWCAHAYPQCAHNELGWIADKITAGTIDYLRQRAAVKHLIELMGGTPWQDGE